MRNAGLPARSIAASDLGDAGDLANGQASAARRRSPRISIRIPGVLSWREGSENRVESVLTISVSRFGCALQSSIFFQPGTRVRLELADKAIEGRVVHSLKDHSTKVVTLGVAFDSDSRELWPLGFQFGR